MTTNPHLIELADNCVTIDELATANRALARLVVALLIAISQRTELERYSAEEIRLAFPERDKRAA